MTQQVFNPVQGFKSHNVPIVSNIQQTLQFKLNREQLNQNQLLLTLILISLIFGHLQNQIQTTKHQHSAYLNTMYFPSCTNVTYVVINQECFPPTCISNISTNSICGDQISYCQNDECNYPKKSVMFIIWIVIGLVAAILGTVLTILLIKQAKKKKQNKVVSSDDKKKSGEKSGTSTKDTINQEDHDFKRTSDDLKDDSKKDPENPEDDAKLMSKFQNIPTIPEEEKETRAQLIFSVASNDGEKIVRKTRTRKVKSPDDEQTDKVVKRKKGLQQVPDDQLIIPGSFRIVNGVRQLVPSEPTDKDIIPCQNVNGVLKELDSGDIIPGFFNKDNVFQPANNFTGLKDQAVYPGKYKNINRNIEFVKDNEIVPGCYTLDGQFQPVSKNIPDGPIQPGKYALQNGKPIFSPLETQNVCAGTFITDENGKQVFVPVNNAKNLNDNLIKPGKYQIIDGKPVFKKIQDNLLPAATIDGKFIPILGSQNIDPRAEITTGQFKVVNNQIEFVPSKSNVIPCLLDKNGNITQYTNENQIFKSNSRQQQRGDNNIFPGTYKLVNGVPQLTSMDQVCPGVYQKQKKVLIPTTKALPDQTIVPGKYINVDGVPQFVPSPVGGRYENGKFIVSDKPQIPGKFKADKAGNIKFYPHEVDGVVQEIIPGYYGVDGFTQVTDISELSSQQIVPGKYIDGVFRPMPEIVPGAYVNEKFLPITNVAGYDKIYPGKYSREQNQLMFKPTTEIVPGYYKDGEFIPATKVIGSQNITPGRFEPNDVGMPIFKPVGKDGMVQGKYIRENNQSVFVPTIGQVKNVKVAPGKYIVQNGQPIFVPDQQCEPGFYVNGKFQKVTQQNIMSLKDTEISPGKYETDDFGENIFKEVGVQSKQCAVPCVQDLYIDPGKYKNQIQEIYDQFESGKGKKNKKAEKDNAKKMQKYENENYVDDVDDTTPTILKSNNASNQSEINKFNDVQSLNTNDKNLEKYQRENKLNKQNQDEESGEEEDEDEIITLGDNNMKKKKMKRKILKDEFGNVIPSKRAQNVVALTKVNRPTGLQPVRIRRKLVPE
ncbi:Hypothetical_protein [Hexamita inflata]|uniref:Hypothetical_protein n=2 Tax=Hexamita inflata TaxID=28002 RepID=A0AA86PV78_9EUKA|nr:Hypothetical protein HINF_LOCUS34504 [Hexamita inflata]